MFCFVCFFFLYASVYFWCSITLYFQISDDNIFPVSKAVLLPVPFVHFPMPLFWDLAVSLVFCLPESCTLFPLSLSFLHPNVQRSSFKKITRYTHIHIHLILLLAGLHSIFPLSQSSFPTNGIEQWLVVGTVLPSPASGDIWQCLEVWLLQPWEMLLASRSGWRPRMRLNMLQCTRQPHTTKNYVAMVTNHLGLPLTFSVITLKILCPRKPLSFGHPGMVGHPIIMPQMSKMLKLRNPALEGGSINFPFFSPIPFPST